MFLTFRFIKERKIESQDRKRRERGKEKQEHLTFKVRIGFWTTSGDTEQWPQAWKRSVFISIPRKGNVKECSNYHIIALISHASNVMLKILQARFQQYMNKNFQLFKLDLEKAEEPEIKLPTSAGSSKKQESSRKTSISALLTTLKPLTVGITTNHHLKVMGIPDHLTCLLRNLYAGQEATVRTKHETTDWFQIKKGVRQGCILSPHLFNL